jgi:murein DD-endopeptidase MepM/ murein hydrolase activator NlpD
MRLPGRPPGDGLFIRHGYAVENTWFNPGYWHAGEDWYLLDGDSGGASVYAVAAGDVVYVGSNYPGRVVIVQHPDGLYSMYGHLDPAVAVQPGQQVERGALLGTLLQRSDTVPDHLHFEIRTFYLQDAVNGATPRYGFPCGVNCPPGPGYWPISAPDHPSDMGWRNPLHVLANRAFAPAGAPAPFDLIVVAQPAAESLTLWSAPPAAAGEPAPEALATVPLQPGERFPLLDSWIGPEDSRETSALAYHIWYHIRLPDGRTGWVQAAVASSFETGSNGRPATIRFNMVPDL